MARSLKNLLEKMTPERRDRIEARARETLREINLRELPSVPTSVRQFPV